MLQEITRDTLGLIREPVFRDYARMYLDIYDGFIRQVETFGLPFEERAVYLLRQNGSLSYQQIAQTTGDSLAGVKSKMRAALAKIHASFRKNEGSIREKVFEQNVGASGET